MEGNRDASLPKQFLYATAHHFYLVGSSSDGSGAWRLLKLTRGGLQPIEGDNLEVHETALLERDELVSLLKTVNEVNKARGGCQFVCKAYGVIGCFRFLEGYYLLLITKRQYQGRICNHKVYSIGDTALVPLVHPSLQQQASQAERRYRKLLLTGVDFTKDGFFFSHSYNLAATLQANMAEPANNSVPFDNMFVWNEFLTRPLREALGHGRRWMVPLIHGFWKQRSLALFGRTLTLTLLARRSKHFAGTRFRKRGVNNSGHVANDVEMEQMVSAGLDRKTGATLLSSVVQMRGSIPLFWHQEGGGTRLKPQILLQHFDPLYSATRAHTEDVRARYGNPIVCLNLVKAAEKRPRETLLRSEFCNAVTYLNQGVPASDQILYVPFDIAYHSKQTPAQVLAKLAPIIDTCLDATSFFVTGVTVTVSEGGVAEQRQHGLLRSNCIDCLDRTNVAQFALGLAALGRQLAALGVSDSATMDPRSSVAAQLVDLYEAAGNTLARQYGGSEAHSTFFQRQRGDWEAATQSRDLMTSLRRLYANTYTDAEKQDAINLLLGNFVARPGRSHIWDLESDTYLHTAGPLPGTPTLRRSSSSYSVPGSSPTSTRMWTASDTVTTIPVEPSGTVLPTSAKAPSIIATRQSVDSISAAAVDSDAQLQDLQPHLSSQQSAGEVSTPGKTEGRRIREQAPLHSQGSCNLDEGGEFVERAFDSWTFATDRTDRRSSLEGGVATPLTIMSQQDALREEAIAASRLRHYYLAAKKRSEITKRDASQLHTGGCAPTTFSAAALGTALAANAFQSSTLHSSSAVDIENSLTEDPSTPGEALSRDARPPSAPVSPVKWGARPAGTVPPSARRPQRIKLDSFDKMLAKQAGVAQEVRLHAPPADRPFLPSWLTSPLGMRRTTNEGSAEAVAGIGRLSTVQETQFGEGLGSAPSLGRFHSVGYEATIWAESALNGLDTAGGSGFSWGQPGPCVLSRATSSPGLAVLEAEAHSPTGGLLVMDAQWAAGNDDLLTWRSNGSEPMWKQSGQQAIDVRAPQRQEKRHGRLRRASYTVGSTPVSAAVAVAQATPMGSRKTTFRSGLSGGSGTDSASMAAPPSIQQLLERSAGDLGISPQLAAWWSGDHNAAAPHWFAQEADLRAAYTKYLDEVQEAQLQQALQHQMDLERTYASMANPKQVVSLGGFAVGAAGHWRRASRLLGASTFGEAELQALAESQKG